LEEPPASRSQPKGERMQPPSHRSARLRRTWTVTTRGLKYWLKRWAIIRLFQRHQPCMKTPRRLHAHRLEDRSIWIISPSNFKICRVVIAQVLAGIRIIATG
jgi:hypothetical protein